MTDKCSGRDRVLRRARDLFVARGFADVSMQEIAEAAGMRKASVYYHFKDKQGLFAQIVFAEMREIRRAMAQAVKEGGGLRENLESLAYVQFARLRSDIVHLAREFRLHVPEDRQGEIHRELDEYGKIFTRIFERAAAAGQLRPIDPRIAAHMFFHLIMEWSLSDDISLLPDDPREAARLTVDLLLHGIAAEETEGAQGTQGAQKA